MKHKKITICFLAVLIAGSAPAIVRHVPQEYPTIQSAIDACQDFDTVIVAPGTYSGSGNRDISLKGKPITVRSTDPGDPQVVNSTIIDCEEGNWRGFVFNMGEDTNSIVAGLTITNGYGLTGGAIYSYSNSSPLITNCVVKNNSAVFGGGIACTNGKSYPVITNCQIIANSAVAGGGGFYLNGSSPTIRNCIISGNVAPDGGAIYSHVPGEPLIVNCTISQNTASRSAGAIYCYDLSNLAISNCILWGDTAPYASEVMVGDPDYPAAIQISYCDIQGGEQNVEFAYGSSITWGQGNIDIDPCFVNPGSNDYHLLPESPCIDAGDPEFVAGPDETDIDGNPRILGAKIDIGTDAGPDETDIDGNPRILGEIIDLGAYEYLHPIEAFVKIMPKTLNLQSNGNWISCTIELPSEYDIADVDTDSIALSLSKEIDSSVEIERPWSRTNQGANKVLVKLSRNETQEMLQDVEGLVELTVSGTLIDGTEFEGTDTIRIVRGGSKK